MDIGDKERFLFWILVLESFLEVLLVVNSNVSLFEKEKLFEILGLYPVTEGDFLCESLSITSLGFPNIFSEAGPFGMDLCLGLVLKAAVVS